ncbi:MAG: hypothetical protein ACTSRA_12280 [Promethearchaeota archaeon]
MKPGDKAYWYNGPDGFNWFLSQIIKLSNVGVNIDYFINIHGDVFYYHKRLVTAEQIETICEVYELDIDGSYVHGIFYGFPECCVRAYIEGSNIQRFYPGTERFWCRPDCPASIKLRKVYRKAVMKNLPQHVDLLEKWNHGLKETADLKKVS